jgi:hypothetical protein
MTISLSHQNPDAVLVLNTLQDVPPRYRSAALLRWAAAYLNGQVNERPSPFTGIDMTEEDIGKLMDDF